MLTIRADAVLDGVSLGDSIAVNGACLTVIAHEPGMAGFEVVPETRSVTNLGKLRIGDRVNLERALRVGDRISGHFVTGHIDCVGVVRAKAHVAGNVRYTIAVEPRFMKYVLPKGSIAVDGISLTIADQRSNTFSVCLVSHTLANTTLGFKGPSHTVNIEFDILAKKA